VAQLNIEGDAQRLMNIPTSLKPRWTAERMQEAGMTLT
jgi:hypothetical protein